MTTTRALLTLNDREQICLEAILDYYLNNHTHPVFVEYSPTQHIKPFPDVAQRILDQLKGAEREVMSSYDEKTCAIRIWGFADQLAKTKLPAPEDTPSTSPANEPKER